MPEGPELYLSCQFINKVCYNQRFGGPVIKSDVSKNPEIPWNEPIYQISACSRGKEIKVTLTEVKSLALENDDIKPKYLDIIVRFGMSGFFKFTTVEDLPKHAHLRFFTADETSMVLSFVDPRRFGRWEVNGDWSKNRGPDPLWEYEDFRNHVRRNLEDSAFQRPICEVMLNQKYFNGIGNYLRAEILYRAKIPPFAQALRILQDIPEVETDDTDLLKLCHVVPNEAITLGGGKWYGGSDDFSWEAFEQWLQCYSKSSMNSMLDHNKRTIWYEGPAGEMAPKGGNKSRGRKVTGSEEDIKINTSTSGSKPKKAKNASSSNPEGLKSEKESTVKIKNEVPVKEEHTEDVLTLSQKIRKIINSKQIGGRKAKTPLKGNSASARPKNASYKGTPDAGPKRRTSTRLGKSHC